MPFNPNRPYNELPPLPPKVEVETKNVLKKTITAGRALAELKGFGETIPDQSMLLNTIVLQEAQTSSEIVQTIKQNDAGIRNLPGTTIAEQRTGKTIYTPPEGEDIIRRKLKELEDFLNKELYDILSK